MRHLRGGFTLILMILLSQIPGNADDTSVQNRTGLGVTKITLSTGALYVPGEYRPTGNGVDLVVHFHGSPGFVRDRFLESGRSAVLVAISFKGLSRAYSAPFEDKRLFRKVLGEALRRTGDHYGLKRVRIRKLVLSSFSAGYGAIREILKLHECQVLVTDIVLADSLYAAYAKADGHNVVDPADMAPFVPFADRAARGKATMWITHSAVIPGTYASTAETADFLIERVGANRVPAGGEDAPGLELTSSADLNGFHVRGYAGDTGPDHMRHLHALAVWLSRTSLDPLAAP